MSTTITTASMMTTESLLNFNQTEKNYEKINSIIKSNINTLSSYINITSELLTISNVTTTTATRTTNNPDELFHISVTIVGALASSETVFPNRNETNIDSNLTISTVQHYNKLSWYRICAVTLFLVLILITVIGNTLVILSVLTTRRLRTVTNCFVMNLAITDWLVGIFVMPPAVILYIVGSWQFGWILCDIWISLDILLCTASILSLCAISLDRYLAIIQPLSYSKKHRSKRLALLMILVVWIVSFAITCPPFLGWYEPGRRKSDAVKCRYNQNKGYVVFSAMGSFFIPLSVMLYVYLRIGIVLTSRRQRITLTEAYEKAPDADFENFLTETEHISPSPKLSVLRNLKSLSSSPKNFENTTPMLSSKSSGTTNSISHPATLYELVEISRSSSMIRCSTINCKYASSNRNGLIPIHAIQLSQSRTSFSECLSSATKFNNLPTELLQNCSNNNHHQNLQRKNSNQQSQHNQNQQHHSHHNNSSIYHRIPPMRISTLKRETKTAKTLTMVMGGFIACWLPFFIYYILIPFLPSEFVSETLMSFLTWIGWVNCAINPFIYAFYSADFRAAFWRLTFRKICKKQQQNHLTLFKG